jgi:hypothetical protein
VRKEIQVSKVYRVHKAYKVPQDKMELMDIHL